LAALPHDSVSSYYFLQTTPAANKSINAPPLLHVLIPLHPLLVVYTLVVTVAAPELNGEKRRGEERRDVE
jgi:hypothetical protein